MKYLIAFSCSCLLLVGCKQKEACELETPAETATKIIHECVCVNNDDTEVDDQEQEEADEIENASEVEEEEVDTPASNLPSEFSEDMTTYTVMTGDTLNKIADLFGITAEEIQIWNNLSSPNSISVGQVLNIFKVEPSTTDASLDPDGDLEANTEIADIREATIQYILNGQGDKLESDRLSWNETFLSQMDIEAIYQQYLAANGDANQIEEFAIYLTHNAPALENWEELFKVHMTQNYGIEITKIEHYGGEHYQTYIEQNGQEVAHVIVSSRTGYYSR